MSALRSGEDFDVAVIDSALLEGPVGGELLERTRQVKLPLVLLTPFGGGIQDPRGAVVSRPVRPSHLLDELSGSVADPAERITRPIHGREEIPRDLSSRLPLRILLAEDNLVNQKVAQLMLRRLGYRADLANNGREVLEALERQRYDIILMDVQMPEMDGLETTSEIHQRYPEGVRPHIIGITAHAMRGDRERFLAAGMDDYLSKPVQISDLTAALLASADRGRTGEEREEEAVQHSMTASPPRELVPATEPIDQDKLAQLRQLEEETTPGLIKKLLDVFERTSAADVATMRQAIEDQDREALREAAHHLKGSCGNFGAERLTALAFELESGAPKTGMEDLGALLREVENELGRVREALAAHRS